MAGIGKWMKDKNMQFPLKTFFVFAKHPGNTSSFSAIYKYPTERIRPAEISST